MNKGEKERKKHVCVTIGAPAYRRTIERRAVASTKESIKKTKTKQNKTNVKTPTRERRHGICKPNARGYKFAPLVASQQGRANEPARARLLWAVLCLVLPVMFGHTTARRSLALAFSAAIHFAMKCSATCSAVLLHSPSSWAAVVHWSALMMPKALSEVVQETPHPLFFLAPTQPAPRTNSPNICSDTNSQP